MPFESLESVSGIPSGTTEIERKAVEEATYQAGAREVFLVEEPIAAGNWCRSRCDEAFW